MAINSIGSSTSLLGQSVLNIKNQLNSLQVQLASGEKSTTYSGMGTGEGFAIAARAQLANITGYQNTITNVGTTISAANTALQSLATSSENVETAANSGSQTLNSTGQTAGQVTATSLLSSMLSVLNTQAGNGYIFSGAATNTPSVASADAILNGSGAQAGLTQVISEREQADLGTAPDLGRLTLSSTSTTTPPTTTVSVAQDSSPFGMKLSAVSSTLTGATVTGPTGTPPAISISMGTTNPNPGDQLNVTLSMPDGTTQAIQLTATTTSPPPTGSFLIGATPAATAANLQTALQTSINTVANTSLVAASAMEASSNFFDQPPQRVSVTPPGTFATATSLVAGTSANTVSWYTGGTTTGSARATQVAQIGPDQTVAYGIQANEQGIASQLQAIAAFAAFTVSPTSTNAAAQVSAMSASVAQALSTQPNQQSIQDIQTDLANAQTTMSTASSLQTQTQASLQNIVSQIETVSPDQVASQILALQTSLQASYQTTSMLSQLSLVKFLPIPSA
jgi:flagellar hook-associated protein 3 FlgL